MSPPRISTAMVMAAGLGTRMRPLTNDRPKALIEVGGRPLIDHMLDRLVDAGVERAVVNVHHCADRLEAHLSRRAAPQIIVSDERSRLLETGGALVKARPLLGVAPILVANSDSIWITDAGAPEPLERLRAEWDPARMDMLLLLARMERSFGFDGRGDFHRDDEGRLRRPERGARAPFAFMGVQIMNPAVLDGRSVEPFSTNRIWDEAIARGRLCGAALDGEWLHVGDPAALALAESRLAKARP